MIEFVDGYCCEMILQKYKIDLIISFFFNGKAAKNKQTKCSEDSVNILYAQIVLMLFVWFVIKSLQ